MGRYVPWGIFTSSSARTEPVTRLRQSEMPVEDPGKTEELRGVEDTREEGIVGRGRGDPTSWRVPPTSDGLLRVWLVPWD